MKRRIWWRLTAVLGLAGSGFVVAVLLSLFRTDDAYAQWGTAELIIDFMEQNDGNWPACWEDLRPHFAQDGCRVTGWSFEELQRHVQVDFTVSADALRAQSQGLTKPPWNVVGGVSFFSPQFGDGPNGILHHYFNQTIDSALNVPPPPGEH